MKPTRFWYLALLSCLLYLIISEIDMEWGFYIKPLYGMFFYLFYYYAVKKHSIVLLIFQITSIIAEVFFVLDLNMYFDEVLYFYFIATSMMLFLFVPILKIKSREVTREMTLEPLLGVLFCAYLIGHMLTLFYDSVPNKLLLIIGAVFLFAFTAVCSLIPLRSGHPSNIKAYIIAGTLVIECVTGFIYYYMLEIPIMFSVLTISICFHKAAVTSYFVDVTKILKDHEEYI